MTIHLSRYTAMLLVLLLVLSCEDEILLGDIEPVEAPINTVYFDINNLTDGPISTLGATPHKLGPERNNPFTVEVLDRARAAVYGTKQSSYGKTGSSTTSDRYIKFTPRTVEHLALLEESDLFLLDFPMTQQLFEYGDYNEAVSGTSDYPALYTTVAVGVPLPNVPYTVMGNLDLTVSDPLVIRKAFELTGNEQEFIDTYGEDFTGTIDLRNACTYEDDEGNTVVIDPSCDIPPSDPGGGGTSTFITNECGCSIFRNQRKPGGTVKVEDTQFRDFLPVRRVEVIAKDSWFTMRRVNTDDRGCWRIDREFSGKGWFWVRFKDKVSNRGKIRVVGAETWRLWQKARTASTFLGVKSGPNFHNILTRFGRWDGVNTGTKTHYGWAAATVNNSLHEFHDLAQAEGFSRLPSRLNLMVGLKRSSGFTTMLRQMGSNNFITAVNQGVGFWAPNSAKFSINDDVGYYLLLATGGFNWPASSPLLNTFMGDVNTGGNFTDSDRMKRLAYHELGHAAHYVGSSITFYRGVIAAEVGAFGHGNPSVNLAGHIQIAESWAEHMALTMVKQTYPSSLNTTNSRIGASWAARQEIIRNESLRHVPIGLYFDLMDGTTSRERVIDENGDRFFDLIDNVRGGYSNSFFARSLNGNIRSPSDLRNVCLSNLPTGVSSANVNQLFDQY